MAEHHTQGREGQGARRRRNNRKSYSSRHRMPRQEEPKAKSTSFVQKVLNFFGFGKGDGKGENRQKQHQNRENKPKPPQKVRVAKPRNNGNKGGNPAAPKKDKPRRERKLNNQPVKNGRIYVGNLSFEATESEVEDLFKGFGNVRSVEIVYNSHTFKSKGFGFVEMQRQDDAQRAVDTLHGQPFMGRELLVRAANERTPQEEGAAEAGKPDTPAQEAPAPAETPAEAPAPVETPAPAPAEPMVEVNFAQQSGVTATVVEPPAEQQQ